MTASPKPMYVRLPAALHEAVKKQAADEERTMAQLIRYALREYLSCRVVSAVGSVPDRLETASRAMSRVWAVDSLCCESGARDYPKPGIYHGEQA